MPDRIKNDKVELKIICPECGKSRASKGSMTGWLFSEKHCTCWSGGIPITPPAKLVPSVADAVAGADLPAEELGPNYQFLSLLGRGGMGSVYKVKDTRLDSVFAVKILNAELSRNSEALKRFYQECEAAARLTHPNLVAVFGHGLTKNGSPYMLMDFVDGESLAAVLIREVYLRPGPSLTMFIQIAEALSYAHSQALVHRDLKPANVMLSRVEDAQIVKLVDFGIAKVLEANSRMTQDLTQAGDVLGTPLYMSPEQCLGFQLDARSDIYSFGCLMCEALTGRPPFLGENPMQIIARHLNEAPIDIEDRFSRMDIPQGFQDVIFACLAKDPQDRYANAESLLADLRALEEGKRPSVSSSRASTRLRSPFVGLALELLPFAAPAIAFTLVCVMSPSNTRKVIDHCVWSAVVSMAIFCFFLAKAYHLKASASMIDKRSNHFARKFRAFYATTVAAIVFSLSQALVYFDFCATQANIPVKQVKYVPPLYIAALWFILALLPFFIALMTRKDSRR